MSAFIRTAIRALPRATAIRPIAARQFSVAAVRFADVPTYKGLKDVNEIKTEEDLLAPGAASGTVPTDLEQSTGLERLELLGQIQGMDIFDLKPLDASRKGTMENPILVKSGGEEQYAGCTGYPVDSHGVKWLTMSHARPIERCPECGSVYKMDFIGQVADHHDDHHGDGHHHQDASEMEPKTMADFIQPEYRYR